MEGKQGGTAVHQRDEIANPLGRTLPGCLEIALIVMLCMVSAELAPLVLSLQVLPSFTNVGGNLDNSVSLNDIHVSVQTPPQVYMNHLFTVTASISAPQPLTSLTGSGGNVIYAYGRTGSLADILRPPASFTGSYALCLIVDMHFDNDSAFDIETTSAPGNNTFQEFTVVPDVTTAQTAEWTVTPRGTVFLGTVHEVHVRVWFDAERTCGTASLLGEMFYLESSSQNPFPPPAKFTVVNADLAVAVVAATTAASVAWAAGFFEGVPRRPRARRKQDASENVPQRRAAKRIWLIVVVPRVALLSIGMVLITLGTSPAIYSLGPDAALVSFYGGIVMALLGIVLLARGVRRIRLADSA
jgi:hypothetical protein